MSVTASAATSATEPGGLSHKQILHHLVRVDAGACSWPPSTRRWSRPRSAPSATICTGSRPRPGVTTAFLITSTISTLLMGKLSDIYGRKPLFMISITIFVIGSALCGLAHSMYELAAFRAIQGLGAGGLFSMALAIIGDIVPPRQRARYQGYFIGRVRHGVSCSRPIVGGFLAGQQSLLGISRLALDLLHQRPDRHPGPHRGRGGAQARPRAPRPPHRLGWPRRRWSSAPRPAVDRCRAGPDLGLGQFGRIPVLLPRRDRVGSRSSGSRAGWATTRCFRCGCSRAACSPSGRRRPSSSAWACSAALVSIPLYLQIVKGASPTRGRVAVAAAGGGHHARPRYWPARSPRAPVTTRSSR